MQSFSQFNESNEIGKHAVDMTQRDPATHNSDGSPKTPEEMKRFKGDVAKIQKKYAQRGRRARLRKLAHETGSTYKA